MYSTNRLKSTIQRCKIVKWFIKPKRPVNCVHTCKLSHHLCLAHMNPRIDAQMWIFSMPFIYQILYVKEKKTYVCTYVYAYGKRHEIWQRTLKTELPKLHPSQDSGSGGFRAGSDVKMHFMCQSEEGRHHDEAHKVATQIEVEAYIYTYASICARMCCEASNNTWVLHWNCHKRS